ncbi:MAG: AAA family ATPase, partial [Treponema sp.]|nr:AAA family ATPase [Treponema sp.]
MSRYRIDLSGSSFPEFIERKLLYVDKTLFIEHFLGEESKVLLVTRPRRMGKSLNMNMLAAFLDLKRESAALFTGLRIEKRPCFKTHLNRYPVVYMDFRCLRAENYPQALRDLLMDQIRKYLPPEKWTEKIRAFAENPADTDSRNLLFLTENLHAVYGQKAVILIDEYDHVLMDNIKSPQYAEIRNYISAVFETALKGNDHLEKALLTGVLRVSQESMFSKLNNIEVYDVFKAGAFDEDFGLTEDEVRALVPAEQFDKVRNWYNNIHVGNSWMFYIYAVMSYLKNEKFDNYWGQSGTINLLGELMTSKRARQLADIVKTLGATFVSEVDPRVSLEAFFSNEFDRFYYGVAIQAGYLTYERDESLKEWQYRIRVPNHELQYVWESYILLDIVNDPDDALRHIFDEIANVKRFSEDLSDFISFKLSYLDL